MAAGEAGHAGEEDDDGFGEGGRGPRLDVPLGEKARIGQEFVGRVFALMGTPDAQVQVEVQEDHVAVSVAGLEGADVRAFDGRALESLQFILNKVVNKQASKRTRTSLSISGVNRRRSEGIDRLAQAVARKVLALERPISIGPMAPADLRLLSGHLARTGGIVVQTTGTQDNRRLVVAPARGGRAMIAQQTGVSGQDRRSSRRRHGRG
jgi:predicted RNA-binding protein Jag